MILLGTVLWGLKGLLQTATGMPAFIITLGGMMGYRGLALLVARREIPIEYDSLVSRIGTGYLDTRLGWIVLGVILLAAAVRLWRARARHMRTWYATATRAVWAG